jgi:glutaconate CoA-transferase subunit A
LRTSLLSSAKDAIATIPDGAIVGIGGTIIADHPMALVRELIRQGKRDLVVVAPTGGLDVDMMIAAGCVRRIHTAYIGAEGLSPYGPAFRAAIESEAIEYRGLDEGMCVAGLRAAAQRLPFLPWRGGVGTSLPEFNPDLVPFNDPIRGEPLLAVAALELDVAIIHADRCDEYGNAQIDGTGHMDLLLAGAADRVIVQADHVVSNAQVRERLETTRFWRNTTVVHSENGAHPFGTIELCVDEPALLEYITAARAPATLRAYLDRWVRVTHDEYLQRVGPERLAALSS